MIFIQNFGKKHGFPKWLLINRGYAKKIINPGGPPVFKLHKKIGKFLLINPAGIINPHLALYDMIDGHFQS